MSDPKYYPQVNFLTGGWNTFWSDKEGYDHIEKAIERAKELSKLYIETRVLKHAEDEIVANFFDTDSRIFKTRTANT